MSSFLVVREIFFREVIKHIVVLCTLGTCCVITKRTGRRKVIKYKTRLFSFRYSIISHIDIHDIEELVPKYIDAER